MNNSDFSLSFLLKQSPEQVFDAINQVSTWWSEDFTGAAQKRGDEFEVRFADVHYSRQRLTEVIEGKKVVWLVTDSRLSFLKDMNEWNGTSIHFDISKEGDQTKLVFTHVGLVPKIQCFKDCSNGWSYYLNGSLIPYITTGHANPNVLEKEVKEKIIIKITQHERSKFQNILYGCRKSAGSICRHQQSAGLVVGRNYRGNESPE